MRLETRRSLAVAAVVFLGVIAPLACGASSNPLDPGASIDGGGPGTDGGDAAASDALREASSVDAGPDAAGPLPYPTRTAYRLKALQPDFWPNLDDVSGNNTGGVSMNLTWLSWEPAKKTAPCAAGTEEEYDGHCFVIQPLFDRTIAEWTKRGLVVTGIVYGVPAWARVGRVCSPVAAGYEIFCAPNDPKDYGRFVGFLAHHYDGKQGHGRVADFVIDNEVNSNDWFDIGCGQGVACDPAAWMDAYAASYEAAYDAVMNEQSTAKVLISLEHSFLVTDAPAAASPLLSGATFLTGFASRVAPRAWRVAYHPYAPNLFSPVFSPDDEPVVGYGNIGILAGWLRQHFPGVPSSWDIELTESGINSLGAQSSAAAQATAVCDTLRNVTGTPGISNYVYHRMVDNAAEGGLGLGLHDVNSVAKAAWSVWALSNRNDLTPPQLSCGFENLPYTRLDRSSSATRGHWASTRIAPSGFTVEQSYRLFRDEQPGAVMLYECRAGQHNLVSRDVACEGLENLGPLGYVYTAPTAGAEALYRCSIGAGTDHFISPSAACEGQTTEQLLGYVIP
jgi:hypothetical protein